MAASLSPHLLLPLLPQTQFSHHHPRVLGTLPHCEPLTSPWLSGKSARQMWPWDRIQAREFAGLHAGNSTGRRLLRGDFPTSAGGTIFELCLEQAVVLASLALGLCTTVGERVGRANNKQKTLETSPSCRGFSPQLSLIKFTEPFLTLARCEAQCQGPAAGIQQRWR